MAKKKVSAVGLEIRKLLAAHRLVIGSERTLKALRSGKLSKVFLSATCSPMAEESIKKYAGIAGVEVKKLYLPSDEVGVLCKKPFAISVLGVLKSK